MNEWQPIESAPKDGGYVILYADGIMVCATWEDDNVGAAGWYCHLTETFLDFEPLVWAAPPSVVGADGNTIGSSC